MTATDNTIEDTTENTAGATTETTIEGATTASEPTALTRSRRLSKAQAGLRYVLAGIALLIVAVPQLLAAAGTDGTWWRLAAAAAGTGLIVAGIGTALAKRR